MNGPAVLIAVGTIACLAVYAALAGADLAREALDARREAARVDARRRAVQHLRRGRQ